MVRFWPQCGDEALGPCTDWRGIPRGPSQLAWRLDFPEATREDPEVPVVTREEPQVSCHNSRKSRRFSPQREMRPFSTVAAREKSYLSSYASKGSLTPLMQLKNFPYIPISTREENRGSHNNSRRAPVFPLHLEMRISSPA